MAELVTLKSTLGSLSQASDFSTVVGRDASGNPVLVSKANLKQATEVAAMDNVFIMYHRKSDNLPIAAKLQSWASLQSSGEIADGVLLVEGGKYLVIAPTEAGSDGLYWSSANVTGGGTYTTDRMTALNDWNGKANTTAQVKQSACNTATYAPGFCNLYSRVNANGNGLTAGKWWLPSLGEMFMIFANMTRINYALSLVNGATQLAATVYWTSTEHSASNAWFVYLNNGHVGTNSKSSLLRRVRAVTAFIM